VGEGKRAVGREESTEGEKGDGGGVKDREEEWCEDFAVGRAKGEGGKMRVGGKEHPDGGNVANSGDFGFFEFEQGEGGAGLVPAVMPPSTHAVAKVFEARVTVEVSEVRGVEGVSCCCCSGNLRGRGKPRREE
jgi:hypothetical protein